MKSRKFTSQPQITFEGTKLMIVTTAMISLTDVCYERETFLCVLFNMGERSGVYGVLVGKPEGKRPLGRPRCRWLGNIKIDLQEVGCGSVDWIDLTQDRDRWWALVTAVMSLRVP